MATFGGLWKSAFSLDLAEGYPKRGDGSLASAYRYRFKLMKYYE